MGSQLLSKLELRLNETCKTCRKRIAAKFKMHLKSSLIKFIRISEVSMHGRILENFGILAAFQRGAFQVGGIMESFPQAKV